MSDRYCYVNCGLPADKCACYKRMLDPMPRPDVTLPPPYSLEAVALQARIAALEAEKAKAEAELATARELIALLEGEQARADRAEALLSIADDFLVEAFSMLVSANCVDEEALETTPDPGTPDDFAAACRNVKAAIQTSITRADRAEALLREAVEALEDIAKPRYGLQAVLEDGGSDDDIAHYYQSVCTQYHSCARATLARIKEAKNG